MSEGTLPPVVLRHVERVEMFVVEGHLYESGNGRRFYVFTAGGKLA